MMMKAYVPDRNHIVFMDFESVLGLVDNSSSEALRPATWKRDPEILLNAQHNCTEIDRSGSRFHVAGRRDLNCQQALILSSKDYNKKTGLVICCPIRSSVRGSITEVEIHNLDKPSVVAASLIQTLSWVERKVKFIVEADCSVMDDVLFRILPLIGADLLIERMVNQ